MDTHHHRPTARRRTRWLVGALTATLPLLAACDAAIERGGPDACTTCGASTADTASAPDAGADTAQPGDTGANPADTSPSDAQPAAADTALPRDSALPREDVSPDTATERYDATTALDAATDVAEDVAPDVPEDTEPLPPHLETTAGSRLAYVLSWDWDGATADDTGVMVFETDLGYTVGLEAGYVGSGQLELIPCSGGTWTPPPEPEPWWRPVLDWLGPRKAWADHPIVTDVSRVQAPVVEGIYEEGWREYGVATVEGSTYCDLHYLITPMEDTSDDGFQMERWSAYARGWYQAPGATERVPFEATINIRGGAIPVLTPSPTLPEGWLATDGAPVDARVLLTRFPARSLDGIALDDVADVDLAYQFLLNIGRTSTAEFQMNR